MNERRPPGDRRGDYAITDNQEKGLFYLQIAQKLFREKVERGESTPADIKKLKIIDEKVILLESAVKEEDPDKKDQLHRRMDEIDAEYDKLEMGALPDLEVELPETLGQFIGFETAYNGDTVAIFTDWLDGTTKVRFNKQSLEKQVAYFKEHNQSTDRLDKVLNSWPETKAK